MTTIERVALTPSEVSKILGLSYRMVLRLCQSGRLHAVKAGDRYLLSQKSVDEFLNGQCQPAKS